LLRSAREREVSDALNGSSRRRMGSRSPCCASSMKSRSVLQLNRLVSSLPPDRGREWPAAALRMESRSIPIGFVLVSDPSAQDSSRAWHGRAAISPVWHIWRQASLENGWPCSKRSRRAFPAPCVTLSLWPTRSQLSLCPASLKTRLASSAPSSHLHTGTSILERVEVEYTPQRRT